jgi:transcriptional regulator with XRE-family HTH domain
MDIGRRRFELREARGMSQGDIEQKSGLLRCYIALRKWAHRLEAPERTARTLDMPL